ncbi:MAG TPA: M1 family metallopeptidase [Puia sp.]|nr:M1 family metallopeptidase [Puia sp.]
MHKKLTVLLLIVCSFRLPGLAQDHYFQQEVHYVLDVTLNDSAHTLDAFARIRYINHSPDTLHYIWFHCWPNAYKNDRTAFSEQLLGNGRTDFYFSDKQARGYINRLEFRVDGQEARVEDHPQYIDIIRVVLPGPLPPGGETTITTPFHVQLPHLFSRSGYTRSSYQITQWYPKPAVYDNHGWHPMPYLDQGEFYSEFGSFDVHITVPGRFTVAATGGLRDSTALTTTTTAAAHTYHYYQDNVHDFAWFADRHFHLDHDTLRLPSGRIIDVYSYYTPTAGPGWKQSITYIKRAILFRSTLIGEYPYNTVTAVQSRSDTPDAMEYPTITVIDNQPTARDLDLTIEHEVGHNWFYGILGTDERRFPWMDEGIDTYYDNRYETLYYGRVENPGLAEITTRAVIKKDQPIATSSEDFTEENYNDIAYTKTGAWLKMLEDTLGTPLFDSCMRSYFRTWQFKHPYPDDLKAVITRTSQRNLDAFFSLLDRKGPLPPLPAHRRLKPAFVFNLRHTDSIQYLSFAPALAFNDYDHIMVGAVIHNFNLPPSPIQFFLAPLYGTLSHRLNGTGGLFWTTYPDHGLEQIRLGITGTRFSTTSAADSNGHQLFGGFYKLTPSLRIVFPQSDPRSTREIALEWKTYLIGENMLDHYVQKSTDSLYYVTAGKYSFRYLNELNFDIRDTRVLYPYKARLQLQQASGFYRINFSGNYFFNYVAGGGLDLRLFGAKFGYLASGETAGDITRFEPKLTAVRGDEDYTYENYFVGRSEFMGLASQQIVNRDGDLHLRTDLFQSLQGRSDNWVASLNLRTTLPRQIVPQWLPLKLFFDVGTYAQAWGDSPPTDHFLYVGGFELDLLHDVLHIYAPLVYSSDFSSQLKTVPDQNSFGKKISFSIDIGNTDFRKFIGHSPAY